MLNSLLITVAVAFGYISDLHFANMRTEGELGARTGTRIDQSTRDLINLPPSSPLQNDLSVFPTPPSTPNSPPQEKGQDGSCSTENKERMAHVTTKCQEKNPSAVAKQKTPREGTTDASSRNKNKVSPPAEGQGTCEDETPKPSSKDNATNCSPPTGDGSSNTSSGDKAKILSSTKDERQNGDALRRLEHAKEMNRSSETQQQEPVPRLLQQARENIEGEPDREATTVIREMASSQEGRDDGGGEDGRGGGGGGRDSLDVQQRRLRQIGLDLRRIADNFQAENGRHLPTIKRDSSQMTTRGVHVAFSQCLSLSILCLIWWKVMNKKD